MNNTVDTVSIRPQEVPTKVGIIEIEISLKVKDQNKTEISKK